MQHNSLRRRGASWKTRSGGFSTLEILISTILIGTLIAGGVYYANIGKKLSTVQQVSLKTAAVVRFPEAIAAVFAAKLSLENVTANDLITTGSVQAGAPTVWAVAAGDSAPTRNTITLQFTLATDAEATELQTYLDANTDTTMVKSATVSGDNNKVVLVMYELV